MSEPSLSEIAKVPAGSASYARRAASFSFSHSSSLRGSLPTNQDLDAARCRGVGDIDGGTPSRSPDLGVRPAPAGQWSSWLDVFAVPRLRAAVRGLWSLSPLASQV
jgi:hypothetical protein